MSRLSNASVLIVVILMVLVTTSNTIASPPKKARIAKTKTELNNILSALQMYKLENGAYPGASQGLLALVEKPAGKPEALNWPEGGYLEKLPKDPWGRHYMYRNPGVVDPVEAYSFGRDGKPGGCKEDADFYSSSLESADSKKCKSQELRQSIFNWLLITSALIIFGLILIYLARKLFISVGGNLYIFFSKLSIWFFGIVVLVLVLSLFMPRIYY